ncbi:polysaccharide biosynthesis protein [Tepidiforma thermophila]|uniref:FlaA1/EpsC-like NDP-sugar epimerase n=1 Tax=Tepidiforma thermophila (strain KCTC 52669 / CGMCC 1.13589 / G233) TaxID=2761530 RepID=A0A2A9HG84_TEPT2|nr:nucleoside-diphosphate sugar epimerase/dehydratase [Tepidiforma thermophila]PFG74151.1 FlaA1/EpsC-like NDP-sugar epimerase [Tepidiforma thermophila]
MNRHAGPLSAIRRLAPGDPLATLLAIALDVLVVGAALACAMLLRFDAEVPRRNAEFVVRVFPLIAGAYVLGNYVFGVYRTVWAYGSIGDIIGLFRPVLLVTLLLFGINFWLEERLLPLSVILITGALVFPGMAVVKMRTRLLVRLPWVDTGERRLLIVGAGHTGQLLARELQANPSLPYQPVGFVDDDEKLLHHRIHGLKVHGTIAELEHVLERMDAEIVAIALERPSGQLVRQIVGTCQRLNIPVRMVPGVDNWVLGHGHDTLREITLDDLLGREPVQVDFAACSQSVRDRVVLVTGAAGSIGSELCRQVLTFRPRELHLLDNNETGLHDLSLELAGVSPETAIRLWVASVTDEPRVRDIFARTRPNLVYHAAALKHVPLMEEHPAEAFRVNVLGTLYCASAAREFQVGTFVLISTDKAVRPSSVMGATKRIAELLVIALARESAHTRFAAVRFGNVMGSRGSVVPTFMKQIERGGPVTVMHPEMQRYFISIPEAVSLVIQAGTFGGRGDIYMLDMGEEINILELAERMIRLRGLRPGEDIEVVFTGPRPGEKLREELVADFEHLQPTSHPKVMRLTANVDVTEREILRLIDEIRQVMWNDPEEVRRRIHLVARRFSREDAAADAPESEALPS